MQEHLRSFALEYILFAENGIKTAPSAWIQHQRERSALDDQYPMAAGSVALVVVDNHERQPFVVGAIVIVKKSPEKIKDKQCNKYITPNIRHIEKYS